jgi:hypothetical protein
MDPSGLERTFFVKIPLDRIPKISRTSAAVEGRGTRHEFHELGSRSSPLQGANQCDE